MLWFRAVLTAQVVTYPVQQNGKPEAKLNSWLAAIHGWETAFRLLGHMSYPSATKPCYRKNYEINLFLIHLHFFLHYLHRSAHGDRGVLQVWKSVYVFKKQAKWFCPVQGEVLTKCWERRHFFLTASPVLRLTPIKSNSLLWRAEKKNLCSAQTFGDYSLFYLLKLSSIHKKFVWNKLANL